MCGGVLLKWGHATAKPKIREFRFHEDEEGDVRIVYKTHKMFAKAEEAEMNLSTFFVKKVRPATDLETKLVTGFASAHTVFTLTAKRCFDVDFYDPDYVAAVGPAKLKTVTLFPAPDSSIGEIWAFLCTVMLTEGIFAPSSDDPDVPEIRRIESPQSGVARKNSVSSSVEESPEEPAAAPAEAPKKSMFASANAEALFNSLPLPPQTAEFIEDDAN